MAVESRFLIVRVLEVEQVEKAMETGRGFRDLGVRSRRDMMENAMEMGRSFRDALRSRELDVDLAENAMEMGREFCVLVV